MRNPPVLVSVIGFFALLAGFGYVYFGLGLIGFDWFGVLGDVPEYESVGLWGWLALAAGIAWVIVAVGLWGLQEWARVLAMFVAGFSLFEAVLAFFKFPGSGIGFAMGLMPVIILLYLNSRDVKEVFAEDQSGGAPG